MKKKKLILLGAVISSTVLLSACREEEKTEDDQLITTNMSRFVPHIFKFDANSIARKIANHFDRRDTGYGEGSFAYEKIADIIRDVYEQGKEDALKKIETS